MKRKTDTGRDPSNKEINEARRIASLHPDIQRTHPSAVESDLSKLAHINTYGEIPDYYIDRPFMCRICGKEEIWKARDQKWYYEEAKGHIDAIAVHCHACRIAKRDAKGD